MQKRVTAIMGVCAVALSVVAAWAQNANFESPALTDCLALTLPPWGDLGRVSGEKEMIECASRYTQAACFSKYAGNSQELYECRKYVNGRLAVRLDAERACVNNGRVSDCFALKDEKVTKVCVQLCAVARDSARRTMAASVQAGCISQYVDNHGHSPLACTFDGAIPHVDMSRLNKDREAALAAQDAAALDNALHLQEGQILQDMQTVCTKACREQGPKELALMVAAQKQGAALVTAYKRCFTAAISSAPARKLETSDTVLYCDYIHQADAQCRTANRCDWVEHDARLICEYHAPTACASLK